MAALYVAIGWRLGWPVSLICAKSHYLCRFDNGRSRHNLEATTSGKGAFGAPYDEDLVKRDRLPPIALSCGSDLRSLTPRETLGVYVGLRGRHLRDSGKHVEAHQDYLLARWLFPNSRRLYIDAMALAVSYGERLFDPGEVGSPEDLAGVLAMQYGLRYSGAGPVIKPGSITLTSC